MPDITFEGQRDLHRLASTYRAALADFDTLTLVPDRWLHLTTQGLGFTDEVPRSAVDAIVREVAASLAEAPAVTVTFGDIVVADEAIAMPAVPPEPIRLLRDAIRASIAAVMGETPEGAERFRPHATVAYFHTGGPAEPYIAAVKAVDAVPVTVTIRHTDLIQIHRDHRMYEWKLLESVQLDG
jgi:2'-5' RNA ligase